MEGIQQLETNGVQPKGDTEDRYLVFVVNGQSFAIEISYDIDIIAMMPITRLPNLPPCLKGVINLRGAITPIMDLRLRFGYEEIPYNDRTCIVVIDNDGVSVGYIVDLVQEVMTIRQEEISPPANESLGMENRYIKGIGRANGQVQLLLDLDRLMEIR